MKRLQNDAIGRRAISVHRLYKPGRGPQFTLGCTLGCPVPPRCPLAETFGTQSRYFTISNSIFNFNFLALVVSEILGGPKCTLRGPAPPWMPLEKKF